MVATLSKQVQSGTLAEEKGTIDLMLFLMFQDQLSLLKKPVVVSLQSFKKEMAIESATDILVTWLGSEDVELALGDIKQITTLMHQISYRIGSFNELSEKLEHLKADSGLVMILVKKI